MPRIADTWVLDFSARAARHRSGAIYRFERFDGKWSARTDNPEPFRSIVEAEGGAERVAEALELWLSEMDLARQLLTEAGTALYGERWRAPLADALGIGRDTLQFWLNGKTPVTVTHPIFVRLADMLEARAAPVAAAAHKIRRAITERPGPEKISRRYAAGRENDA